MSIAEKLITIAENEPKVYEAGQIDGEQSEWSQVWDGIQEKGRRKYYAYLFSGNGWNDNNFKPKYDIVPNGGGSALGGYGIFYGCGITNLTAALNKAGVSLDTSNEANLGYAFAYSSLTHIPTVNVVMSRISNSYLFYYNSNLTHIEKVIVDEKVTYTRWFGNTPKLEHISFEGEIGQDISFSGCDKLTHDSLMSIINALKDFRTETTINVGTIECEIIQGTYENLYGNVIAIDSVTLGDLQDGPSGVQYYDGVYFHITNESGEPCILRIGHTVDSTDAKSYTSAKSFIIDRIDVPNLGYRYSLTLNTYIEPTATKTLTIDSTNLAKLTDAEKVTATEKGWTLA